MSKEPYHFYSELGKIVLFIPINDKGGITRMKKLVLEFVQAIVLVAVIFAIIVLIFLPGFQS